MGRKRALRPLDIVGDISATKRPRALETRNILSRSNYSSHAVTGVTGFTPLRISRPAPAHNGATETSDIVSDSKATASNTKAGLAPPRHPITKREHHTVDNRLTCKGCGRDDLPTIQELHLHKWSPYCVDVSIFKMLYAQVVIGIQPADIPGFLDSFDKQYGRPIKNTYDREKV